MKSIILLLSVAYISTRNLQEHEASSYQTIVEDKDTDKDQQYNWFHYVRNIDCAAPKCEHPYGRCIEDNKTCACEQGYVNDIQKNEDPALIKLEKYCTYKQKKQLTAFLLELLIAMGVGHLYAGRLDLGLPKLFLTLLVCILGGARFKADSGVATILSIISCIVCCGLFVWEIVDLVFYGTNKYSDGNGKPLKEW